MSAGRKIVSDNKHWNTPPKYIELINQFFDNNIDLDPCSNEHSMLITKYRFTVVDDGLKQDWNFKNIYVNPPYGKNVDNKTSIYNWIYKGYESYKNYNSELLYLIPVATNTKHFKDIIFKYANGICFLNDTRLKFYLNGEEYKKGAPMSCCMVYFGNDYNKFKNVFNSSGKCLNIQLR